MAALVLLVVASYLLGSIPTSVLVARRARGIDIRQHGSGNAGGTNVLRVVGWRAALVVAVVDVGKGFAAAMLPRMASVELPVSAQLAATLCGAAAVVGHVFPLFAQFRGGKGVGTAAGMILAIHPWAVVILLPVFSAVLALTRIVSVASITAALCVPLSVMVARGVSWVPENEAAMGVLVALGIFVIVNHRTNIHRLMRGTESRL